MIFFLTCSPGFVILGEMGNISKWKESLAERTVSRQTKNLMQLVYGEPASISDALVDKEINSEDDDSEDDDFFKPKGEGNKVCY